MRRQVADDLFKLNGPVLGRMRRQDAFPRIAPDLQPLHLRQSEQDVRHVLLIAREKDLLAWRKKFIQAFPIVRENRCTAS
jgi:hypothetical protein